MDAICVHLTEKPKIYKYIGVGVAIRVTCRVRVVLEPCRFFSSPTRTRPATRTRHETVTRTRHEPVTGWHDTNRNWHATRNWHENWPVTRNLTRNWHENWPVTRTWPEIDTKSDTKIDTKKTGPTRTRHVFFSCQFFPTRTRPAPYFSQPEPAKFVSFSSRVVVSRPVLPPLLACLFLFVLFI